MSHDHDNCWVPIFEAWAEGATDVLDFGDCPTPTRLKSVLATFAVAGQMDVIVEEPVFVDPEEDYHYVQITDDGWFMQHPLTCRPNLMACVFNKPVGQTPKPDNGRYRVTINGTDLDTDEGLLQAVKFWPMLETVSE